MSKQETNSHIYDGCTRTWKNTYGSILVLLPWYLIVWHVQRSMKDFSVVASSIRFWFFAGSFCLKGLLIIWEINGLIHFIHPVLLLTDHKMFLKVECNVNGGVRLMVWLSCLGISVVLQKTPFLFGTLNSNPKVSSVRGNTALGLDECWRENFPMLI